MHQSLSLHLHTGHAFKQSTHEQADKMQTQEAFVWIKHWYPLSLETDLDIQTPTPHTLLNIDMVIWKDGEGNWGACEDRCPHRSAATALPNLCMLGTKMAQYNFATSWQAARHVCPSAEFQGDRQPCTIMHTGSNIVHLHCCISPVHL